MNPFRSRSELIFRANDRSLAEDQRYRRNFAPALKKERVNRFAGEFRGSRKVLEEIVDGR
jgi:hypothetical protein